MEVGEFLFVYALGALAYGGVERFWRGWTHWSMLLLGGSCFVLIYLVTVRARCPLPLKWLLCALGITALEFAAGCVLNLLLGWAIWDYAAIPGNLLGQICPLYTACWLLLSIPASGLAWGIRKYMFSVKS